MHRIAIFFAQFVNFGKETIKIILTLYNLYHNWRAWVLCGKWLSIDWSIFSIFLPSTSKSKVLFQFWIAHERHTNILWQHIILCSLLSQDNGMVTNCWGWGWGWGWGWVVGFLNFLGFFVITIFQFIRTVLSTKKVPNCTQSYS